MSNPENIQQFDESDLKRLPKGTVQTLQQAYRKAAGIEAIAEILNQDMVGDASEGDAALNDYIRSGLMDAITELSAGSMGDIHGILRCFGKTPFSKQ